MPMYTYVCECGESTEEYVKNLAEEVVVCPKCEKEMKPEFPVTSKPIIH